MTKKERIKHQDWITSYRKSLTAHFKKRCADRLSWQPSDHDIQNLHTFLGGRGVPDNCIILMDDEEQKKLYVRSIEGRKWYCMKYKNLTMEHSLALWVCYDTKVKNVITVLPLSSPPFVAGCANSEVEREFNEGFKE